MFDQSPFIGNCSAATYEVLAMLIGTFLLGLLLGFLIWGWLRKKAVDAKAQADKWKHISDLRQVQIVDLTTLNTSLQEKVERIETRISLADFRMRKSQEEAEALKSELALKHHVPEPSSYEKEEPSSLESSSEIRHSKSEIESIDDEPTLADITKAMETRALDKPTLTQSETPFEEFASTVSLQGPSDESLEMARSIFDSPIDHNDLKVIYGIDLKMEEILHRAGVITWSDLALRRLPDLRKIVEDAGPRYRSYDPKTWAIQARMAAKGEWKKLRAYQEALSGDEE